MRDYIDPAIARIMRNSKPVGAGCLVRGRLLVTCAHVVRDALGLEQAPDTRPTDPVDIEFTVCPSNGLKGVVGAWYPPSPSLADDGLTDIAVLVVVGDMGRAEPCHLLRRHDNRLGTTKAYGFPEDATHGSRHGEWLEAWAGDPLVGPAWFPLWRDDQRKQFIRPGYSGGPVVVWDGDYAGQVAGIVAHRKREEDGSYEEAWAIGAEALRNVLSGIDVDPVAYRWQGQASANDESTIAVAINAAVSEIAGIILPKTFGLDTVIGQTPTSRSPETSSERSKDDLDFALREVSGICREHLEQPSSNLPTDLLERIELLATALLRAKGSDGAPDLQLIVDYNERLVKATAEAGREEVLELFETSPLRSVVDRLDALAGQVEPSDRSAADVRINWNHAESETTKAAHALDEEAEKAQNSLWPPAVDRVEKRKRNAWHHLQDLRITIKEADFSTAIVHWLRGKLESYRFNLLKRTIALSGCLLGQFADRLKPGTVFRDVEYGPEMVVIPAGNFLMGSPENEEGYYRIDGPQHRVTVARSFAFGRYPVTFEEYDQFCCKTGRNPPSGKDGARACLPVINVSFVDAEAYLAWLSNIAGQPYRLPSEAEWEYACRAGTTMPFWTGETISTDQANYDGNHTYGSGKKGEYRAQTSPVDAFESSGSGLYDMHGNVWEWCADHWHENYEGAPTDGSTWSEGGEAWQTVVRGGGWACFPEICRSACRSSGARDDRDKYSGFRAARTLG